MKKNYLSNDAIQLAEYCYQFACRVNRILSIKMTEYICNNLLTISNADDARVLCEKLPRFIVEEFPPERLHLLATDETSRKIFCANRDYNYLGFSDIINPLFDDISQIMDNKEYFKYCYADNEIAIKVFANTLIEMIRNVFGCKTDNDLKSLLDKKEIETSKINWKCLD